MDIPKCDAALQQALKEPRPKQLVEAINTFLKKKKASTSSSNDDPTHLEFICLDCKSEGVEGKARAFFASPPAIVLCANRLNTTEDVKEVVVHELIHAYDYTVRNMDLTQPAVLACRCVNQSQYTLPSTLLVLILAKYGRRASRNASRRPKRYAKTRNCRWCFTGATGGSRNA
ncbi:hypothetical protein, variant 3 [Aphanomyces astaci]|uniref:Mitochondrial inner membrane protease ATP23 n=1 Tax=Aphanomyces astaci TaxID=112090 RepID=W4GV74_APHAT|nr:hypothetical protein, variant 2 [Aphanomyces astaci]XP_009826987.1 hypothetical protein, variant 3 [Aphanomyces astaci]ETV83557.1 hypothetical protein, variant 2 [Aphanomyces astaci]ETV83558.1 hypothetical protein, variant 3 [Aphanomyces astaci]|eukprot:XP_009826986.1 hypothetical protein, variant 2 [Aphanomyces astaci]